MQNRPSAKGLRGKVCAAINAVQEGLYQFPITKHLSSDLDALQIGSEDELMDLVLSLLNDILKQSPDDCYRGGHPPQRSYEQVILNQELWAFVCFSTVLNKYIYLKFVLKKDVYFYVDCHEDRP